MESKSPKKEKEKVNAESLSPLQRERERFLLGGGGVCLHIGGAG